MHIKSIELDGFKSYSRKALINGFDKEFNAITGYNGSGKSNILDGICFLLGITRLENIRAKSMNDLVFKQGQAGIIKASVTITFDNRDKSLTPMGYEKADEIVVRRSVVVNGRTGYSINGIAYQNNRVADFFRSVGLNVNNPHFLIMQGRITKVLGMKPEEILGMIEEAAGTKMYEQKKNDSMRTIQNKELKVEEIDKLLREDIAPLVDKMKEDRKNLIEYNRINKTLESWRRKKVAYTYYRSLEVEQLCNKDAEKCDQQIANNEEEIGIARKKISDTEKLLSEHEKNKKGNDAFSHLEETLKGLTEERLAAESELEEARNTTKNYENERKMKIDSLEKDERNLVNKVKELDRIKEEEQRAIEEQVQDESEASQLRTQMEALAKGLITNSTGETVSVEEKIQESRTEAAEIEADLKTAVTRRDRLGPMIKELKGKYEKQSKQQSNEMQELKQRETNLVRSESELSKLSFDEERDQAARTESDKVKASIDQITAKMQQALQRFPRMDASFKKLPTGDFNYERDVVGPIITLFRVKDPQHALPVEVAAGGAVSCLFLHNVPL
ncbi:unnamed protein product [Caenorhabditis auriculariae]|uniref:RecF/RecN/SMC N-terminal domain-containing protein n=1 Tax=Caenorhabditis auriculariae TaxID=2777116 RepID=A0A8S1H7X1_9PELO|nr:unnamed protein product [Caenorhabditis auriculariae]